MSEQTEAPPLDPDSLESVELLATHLSAMVDRLPNAAVFVEHDKITLNSHAEQITGYSNEEIRTRDEWFSKLCQMDPVEAQAVFETIRESGYREPVIFKIVRSDGATRTLKFAAHRFDDHEVWFLNDMTARREAEDSAQKVAKRLQATLNATVDSIITIDHAGIIYDVNPATEEMFGFKADEMIGKNVSILMPSPYQEQHDGYLANYHETGEAHIIGIGREVRAQRKDGTIFPIDLSVSEVEPLDLFVGVVRDISDRRRLEQEVLSAAEDQQLATAHELHDGLGSLLSAIKFRIEGLQKRISPASVENAEEAAFIAKLVRDAISQTRAISHGLHPVGSNSEDLFLALRSLAASVPADAKIGITFDASKEVLIDEPGVANHLFRIAQEAVNNALRHSGGTTIKISIVEEHDLVTLSVIDNGNGIEQVSPSVGGIGLHTMSYRAHAIGAALDIGLGEEGGTIVECRISRAPAEV